MKVKSYFIKLKMASKGLKFIFKIRLYGFSQKRKVLSKSDVCISGACRIYKLGFNQLDAKF